MAAKELQSAESAEVRELEVVQIGEKNKGGRPPKLTEAAIAHFAQTVEEHSLGQRVLCLAFIQTNVHASPQLGILQPVERK